MRINLFLIKVLKATFLGNPINPVKNGAIGS